MERGYGALQVMENHLKAIHISPPGSLRSRISLFGYTHLADRCDYDLATFPAIRAWLRRVNRPRFRPHGWRGCRSRRSRRHRRRRLG
jgi:glutathione S-transferase